MTQDQRDTLTLLNYCDIVTFCDKPKQFRDIPCSRLSQSAEYFLMIWPRNCPIRLKYDNTGP